MKEICIKKLTVNHPQKGNVDFHCHLIVERIHCNSTIRMKMYGENIKSITWIADFLAKNEIPNLISIEKENINDDKVIAITLPSEKVSGVSYSSDFYENGLHYYLLTFKEVYIEKKLSDNESKLKRIDSYFHLSEQAVHLFGDNYFYSSNNIGTWKATNRQNKFRKFLNHQYKFLILFPPKQSFHKGSSELILSRNPVINVRYNKGKLNENFPKLMVKLISYYLTENIDYHFGFIYNKKSKVEHYKNLKYYQFRDKPIRCRHSDFNDIFDFISSIRNKSNLLNDSTDLIKSIDKFVLASILKSESKFMLYFSIFEGVRNKMNKISKIGIQENFAFIEDPRDELQEDLKKYKSIVKNKDKIAFEESLGAKITNIKRYPVKKQFESFLNFKSIKLNLNDYGLSLGKILNLRNRIFHGSFIKDDSILEKVNPNLERLASKMIRIQMKSKDNFDKR